MNKNDLRDLKNATKEIYSTFFSTEVEFRYLLPENEPNIYGELKKGKRAYSDPITLVAQVDLNPLAEEIRSDIGSTTKVKAKFEVPTVILEETGVLDLSIQEIRSGKITFQNIDYSILGFFPVTNVDEIFLFYQFEVTGDNE